MTLLKTEEWVSIIDNVGFKNIEYWRVGEKDDWKGTLIISATKN